MSVKAKVIISREERERSSSAIYSVNETHIQTLTGSLTLWYTGAYGKGMFRLSCEIRNVKLWVGFNWLKIPQWQRIVKTVMSSSVCIKIKTLLTFLNALTDNHLLKNKWAPGKGLHIQNKCFQNIYLFHWLYSIKVKLSVLN